MADLDYDDDEGDYDDDEGGDEEEMAAMQEAMELNAKLKAMAEQMAANEAEMQNLGGGNGEYNQADGYQAAMPRGAPGAMKKKKGGVVEPELRRTNKSNYTHNDQAVQQMTKNNEFLLNKMQRIALSGGTGLSAAPEAASFRNKKCTSKINRNRKDDQTQRENMAMLKRLQNVKPSINRSALAKDAKKNQKIGNQIRAMKPAVKRAPRPQWED
jgi:hypothetical protein